jgi:hypothetical protein
MPIILSMTTDLPYGKSYYMFFWYDIWKGYLRIQITNILKSERVK